MQDFRNMDHFISRVVLDAAVACFERGEPVGDDVLMYSSTSAIGTSTLPIGTLIDIARLDMSSPTVSWRLTVDVDDGLNLRVVLREVSAQDTSCLRVRGDVHVRPISSCTPPCEQSSTPNHAQADEAAPAVREEQRRFSRESYPWPRRAPIVTVMEGPGTVASVDAQTITELKLTMTTFYYSPSKNYDDQSVMQLCVDLERLLFSKDMADVVLLVEEEEIPAHKAMLGTRSGLFRSLFQKHEFESILRINLPSDVSLSIMSRLMHYMYTGFVEAIVEEDDIVNLLAEACRFEIHGLEDWCTQKLSENLSQENALKLWAFAEDHGVERLKKKALLVLVEHLKEVTSSKSWRAYTRRYPSLAVDILEYAAVLVNFSGTNSK